MVDWNCPFCGSELDNVAEQLKEHAIVEGDVLGVVDQIFGYYCSDCDDFYGNDSLKELATAA